MTSRKSLVRIGMLFFMAVAVVCTPAYGQGESTVSEPWEFQVIPYMWALGMEGDVGIGGAVSSVDMSFGDIWDNLDFAGMMHVEARKGRWGLFLDPLYAKMSMDGKTRLLKADVDVEMAIVELGAFYRLNENSSGVGAEPSLTTLTFDVLAGGRYMHVDTDIDIKGLGPFGARIKIDDNEDWVDPFIGLRVRANLTRKLFLNLRGDIGGFGISDCSDVAGNLMGVLGYQLNERTAILGGYRYLSVDYEDGSGSDLFKFDTALSGPIFGVSFTF